MYTYLLSVSLLRIRGITPSPRLTETSMAALAERWAGPSRPDVWRPESGLAQPEARRPDRVAAAR